MLEVAHTLSEHEYIRGKSYHPKQIKHFVHTTQFFVMIPPLFASVLYYPATINFLERISITDPDFQRFVALSCIVAELCLYEVKTAKFGELLGTELHRISYLLEPKWFWQYIKDNIVMLSKHLVIGVISLVSSYVYGYLSQELTGNLFLSIATVIAKFTTFHFAITDLTNYLIELFQDPEISNIKKLSITTGTLLLGISGSTYVYGKSEVAFEKLTGNPSLAVAAAALSVLPTAFLTGTSLINFFGEFKKCARPTCVSVCRELLISWLGATAAAPNSYFLDDWGRDKIEPFWLWLLVIIVGITSLITKRDALYKATDTVAELSRQCYHYRLPRFFSKNREQEQQLLSSNRDIIVPHAFPGAYS